jgi:hypothetical protein
VWADIPFFDCAGTKGRPVVVVNVSGCAVTVLPVTTSLRRVGRPAVYQEVTSLSEAGLSRPSGVHKRPVVIDRSRVSTVLGRLGTADYMSLFVPSPDDAAA